VKKFEVIAPRPDVSFPDGVKMKLYQVWVNGLLEMEFWLPVGSETGQILGRAGQLIAERNSGFSRDEKSPSPHITIRLIKCWSGGCGQLIDRNRTEKDGPYGNRCSFCGNSLRHHPFFGKDKEFDMGDDRKPDLWKRMTGPEKSAVRIKHGFR